MAFHMQPDLVWGYFGGSFAEYRKGAIFEGVLGHFGRWRSPAHHRWERLDKAAALAHQLSPDGLAVVD